MVSTISGPIPPHPSYETYDSGIYVKLVAPRIKPEAEDIARQGRGTLCLALETEGYRTSSLHSKTSNKFI